MLAASCDATAHRPPVAVWMSCLGPASTHAHGPSGSASGTRMGGIATPGFFRTFYEGLPGPCELARTCPVPEPGRVTLRHFFLEEMCGELATPDEVVVAPAVKRPCKRLEMMRSA